jgi:hypothetical protein
MLSDSLEKIGILMDFRPSGRGLALSIDCVVGLIRRVISIWLHSGLLIGITGSSKFLNRPKVFTLTLQS